MSSIGVDMASGFDSGITLTNCCILRTVSEEEKVARCLAGDVTQFKDGINYVAVRADICVNGQPLNKTMEFVVEHTVAKESSFPVSFGFSENKT